MIELPLWSAIDDTIQSPVGIGSGPDDAFDHDSNPRVESGYFLLSALTTSMCNRKAEDRHRAPTTELTCDGLRTSLKAEVNRNSELAREIAALQIVIAQMQEELIDSKAREEHARHLALHDDLTALPNRRYFRERLEVALAQEASGPLHLAVLYVDLDGFKALNDGYGHATGDRLLHVVGARLTHSMRAEDFVCGLGGDEYACLITGVSRRARLRELASTLFHAVSAPIQLGALALTVRASIGIAVYPARGWVDGRGAAEVG